MLAVILKIVHLFSLMYCERLKEFRALIMRSQVLISPVLHCPIDFVLIFRDSMGRDLGRIKLKSLRTRIQWTNANWIQIRYVCCVYQHLYGQGNSSNIIQLSADV